MPHNDIEDTQDIDDTGANNDSAKSALVIRRLADELPTQTHCAACGVALHCGVAAGDAHCWCMDEPQRLPVPTDAATGCLCQRCLRLARTA
jgi:ribosomal protein L34E